MKHLWFFQDVSFVLALVKQVSYVYTGRNFLGDWKCIRHCKVWKVYVLTRHLTLFLVQLQAVQDIALAGKAVWLWCNCSNSPEWSFAEQRSLAKAWRSKLNQRLSDDILVNMLDITFVIYYIFVINYICLIIHNWFYQIVKWLLIDFLPLLCALFYNKKRQKCTGCTYSWTAFKLLPALYLTEIFGVCAA